MEPIDFKKTFKEFYSPKPGIPEEVILPRMQFVMIDGEGDPEKTVGFQDAIGALYGTVYGLKFSRKKRGGRDFGIAPLEGLWWTPGDGPFDVHNKATWRWTLMIWLPDDVTPAEFAGCIKEVKAKRLNPALDHLRLEVFNEERAVQLLHVGPYSAEGPNIEKLHAYAAAKGLALRGKHHEIYLGDPRRAAPERLKTIIRQPVA